MNILDEEKEMVKYDKSKVALSIGYLPRQLGQAWAEVLKIKLPLAYAKCQQIVFCGMGGSNLASELVRSIYGAEIKKPFVLVRNYNLPAFVNKNTLVIISSYSGNTEESISCLKQAKNKKAKIFCLASGGKIMALAQKNKLPFYKINTKYNPSGQPRYGLGSQLGAALALFSNLKIIKINNQEIANAVEYLEIFNKKINNHSPSADNWAKNLALKLSGRLPILIAAEFLSANARILANQINESAKNLAFSYLIPELNHHLMDGLSWPPAAAQKIKVLFFNARGYSQPIAKRFLITQKVLKKQQINFIDYLISGESKLLACLEILLLGSWLSFYLAVLNKKDPAQVPWVDFFKKELEN